MNESKSFPEKEHKGASRRWRPFALLAAIILMIVLSQVFGVGQQLEALRGWILSLGMWGPLVYVLIYGAAAVAALPGSVLTIAAGALFGPVVGIITVLVGSTFGAALAFLVGRYFARDAVANWLSGNERFRKLDLLTEKHGAIIVALTRLVPIFPYNLLNYGFGLTRVPFWTYVMWTGICMLPAIVLYVVGAAAIYDAISKGGVPWTLIIVFAAVIVVLTFLVRYARGKLQSDDAGDPVETEPSAGGSS